MSEKEINSDEAEKTTATTHVLSSNNDDDEIDDDGGNDQQAGDDDNDNDNNNGIISDDNGNDDGDHNKNHTIPPVLLTNNGGELTPDALAVIEMMKRQNLIQHSTTTTAQQQLLAAIDPRSAMNYSNNSNNEKHHAFWDTQPMPRGEMRSELPEGPIVPNKPISEIRQEPYTMPNGFFWSNVTVNDPVQVTELYTLLTNNYVEDDDALFRFDYSPEFLLWALDPPSSNPDFLFGVRSMTTKKLVAFISGVPTTTQVYDNIIPVVEINFLCVHKKLRSKRLAPVLIKEITRRVNLTGVFQAVYTAGQVLPVPVSSARYYHRSLNPKKLVQVGFSRLPSSNHRMTMARMLKLYKLPAEPQTPKLRPMTRNDVIGVHKLLTNYLKQYSLKILFTVEEIEHWLLPRPNVIHSYVIVQNDHHPHDTTQEPNKRIVTDFISFYFLPSSILNYDENTKLYATYSYYNVATTVSIQQLMKDALILAKNAGADVFNALDLMNNKEFLEALKFGIGDGQLQYYIYNWTCQEMLPKQVGIVLL